MAKIVRTRDLAVDEAFEPGVTIERGIHSDTVDNPKMAMGHTVVPPGSRNQRHYHVRCDAGMYILKGRLRMSFGPPYKEKVVDVEPGDFVFVPQGEIHGLQNLSDKEPAELVFCIGGTSPEDVRHYKEDGHTVKIEPPST